MNRCCFCLAALVMLAGGTGHVSAGGVAVSSTLALEADSNAGSGNVTNTSAASRARRSTHSRPRSTRSR